MKKIMLIASALFLSVVFIGCFFTGKQETAQQTIRLYQQDIASLNREVALLVQLIDANATPEQIQKQFKEARKAYKKIEWLAEYYNPYTVKYINGAALEEVEADEKNVVIQPEGFLVLEELLFPIPNVAQKEELLHQAKVLQSNTGRLQQVASNLQTTDAHIFDALRLEVFRILTLGISGFDSPIAHHSLPEALSSLEGMQTYFEIYEEQLQRIHYCSKKSIAYSYIHKSFYLAIMILTLSTVWHLLQNV
ncbi:hypothetical protein OCK74_04260 [Chitinophagaceae bacterium LB-8]|uniref:Uncharacterized protein n=1 Tax=Paraflavisolibacter caeni TaxID=2982496 RepID=A0A9X2XTY3_9BACT|nr:hypothetical protein [Paraflavisolibacter caeni]MCU7548312.1 hypothetical protein [Paraflavisolibacter caeni]